MDFVDVGKRVILLGQRHDRGDRRDVAVHRIEALEHDHLRAVARLRGEQLLEMGDVVMPPYPLLAARAPDALDHRIVIERVGQDEAIGQEGGDGRNRRKVGYPPGSEDERRRLAMQVGKLGLELDDRIVGAGNVAGSARPCPVRANRLDRGLDDVGMAAHAEIIVRAPDRHFARPVFLALGAPLGDREPARVTLEIGEGAVAPFRLQARNRVLEAPLIVHRLSFSA